MPTVYQNFLIFCLPFPLKRRELFYHGLVGVTYFEKARPNPNKTESVFETEWVWVTKITPGNTINQ